MKSLPVSHFQLLHDVVIKAHGIKLKVEHLGNSRFKNAHSYLESGL